MKNKLTLLILLTIVLVGFCFFRKQISYEIYRKINIISAGSYPYAETYNLNYSESEVKNAIKKLKELHPEYKVPENIGEYELNDHQTKDPAFWYVTFFYFQGENEVIQTWIRNNGKTETTFAFVQVNQIRTNSWKKY